jgi:glutamyl-tRNA(Gln) amidotransferase subunit E
MDYKKIGLKCGIEIHQQLTGKKLFCDCPAALSEDDDGHTLVHRKLRAVVGETGKVDEAAAREQAKAKTFIYRAYPSTCCLVELDEEPPHLMNHEALYTTLQMAKLLNASIVDEVQTMRKTVVDGSNTSGFQRTALVARNGFLQTTEGKVGIPTISLEEDAAKIIERGSDADIYNLSRLGIPLIEIGTDPDIVSPEHCKEVAAMLGMLLRSTGRVRRGLGTIRQDVNVSIKQGARIEIKGAQDLDMIPTLVENEAERQLAIVGLRSVFAGAKVDPAHTDVSRVFAKTACSFAAKALAAKKMVIGFKMSGMHGVLGKELQPGKRVGTDLSDYAKVHGGIGGIIHSDEDLKKYKFSDAEIAAVREKLAVGKKDGFIMIVGTKAECKEGYSAVAERITLLAKGVPKEVRKAHDDGTTSYLRPLPGADRMYPETDTLPAPVASKVELPELIDDKIMRYQKKFGLSKDLSETVARGTEWPVFEDLVVRLPSVKPASIAETITAVPAQLKRKYGIERDIPAEEWSMIFTASISPGSIVDAFVDVVKKQIPLEKALETYQLMSKAEVKKVVDAVLAKHKDEPFGKIMNLVMQETKGRADGKLVSELVRKKLG